MIKGVCRIHKIEDRGGMSIYVKKEIAAKIKLPLRTDHIIIYDEEKREICIREL